MVSKEVDARSIIKPFSHAKYIQVRVLFFLLRKKIGKNANFFSGAECGNCCLHQPKRWFSSSLYSLIKGQEKIFLV